MNRSQKEATVAEVRDALTNSAATFLINYQGTTVASLQSLRKKLFEKGSKLKVTKARLMKIAADSLEGAEGFREQFKDQVGLVFAPDQVSEVAKDLIDFSKENETVKVLSGFYESSLLSQSEVEMFASLPSREVLLGQVVGTMQAPIAQFARVLSMLITRLLYLLQRRAESLGAA